jgi:hypothetical protein
VAAAVVRMALSALHLGAADHHGLVGLVVRMADPVFQAAADHHGLVSLVVRPADPVVPDACNPG